MTVEEIKPDEEVVVSYGDEVMVEIDGHQVRQSEIDISVISQAELRKDERYLSILNEQKVADDFLSDELEVVSDYLDVVEGLSDLQKQATLSNLKQLIAKVKDMGYQAGWWSGFAYEKIRAMKEAEK